MSLSTASLFGQPEEGHPQDKHWLAQTGRPEGSPIPGFSRQVASTVRRHTLHRPAACVRRRGRAPCRLRQGHLRRGSPSVLQRTKVFLFSIMTSTASFSQYWAVMMAMVGCWEPCTVGICRTSFTSARGHRKETVFRQPLRIEDVPRNRGAADLLSLFNTLRTLHTAPRFASTVHA